MKRLDGMSKDELEEMEIVRARRLDQMKASAAKRQRGHGEYREIGGSGNEQEFFDAAKQSDKMVCHFYRESTERCTVRVVCPVGVALPAVIDACMVGGWMGG